MVSPLGHDFKADGEPVYSVDSTAYPLACAACGQKVMYTLTLLGGPGVSGSMAYFDACTKGQSADEVIHIPQLSTPETRQQRRLHERRERKGRG